MSFDIHYRNCILNIANLVLSYKIKNAKEIEYENVKKSNYLNKIERLEIIQKDLEIIKHNYKIDFIKYRESLYVIKLYKNFNKEILEQLEHWRISCVNMERLELFDKIKEIL